MKVGIIKTEWSVTAGRRLDSKFHLSDGNKSKRIVNKLPYSVKPLSEVTEDIYNGARFRRQYVKEEQYGIPFMGSSDMLKSNLNSLKFISKKYSKNIEALTIKKDWVLVSCSGTIGNTVYTNEDFEDKTASQHIMRIIPNEEIHSGYLYAFLSSKFGYALLTEGTYGAVIQHIEPNHISDLPVPIFPNEKQQVIHNLVIESAALRVEANKLLQEVTDYFNQKYPVNRFHQKVFVKNIKELDFSWAAYNNNQECSKINELLKDESFTIGEVADNVFSPPMFKHIYLKKDNGYPFLTGSELTRQNIRYYRWLSPRGVKDINDYIVHKGTLLLYKSGTTDGGILGNVFIIDENQDGVCLSDHLIRINIEDLKMSYWIFAFLKSEAGIKLLQRLATGTMIPFITPERLRNLRIPNPHKEFEIITNKVSSYLEKRALANQKETQAIHLVENEIESWEK